MISTLWMFCIFMRESRTIKEKRIFHEQRQIDSSKWLIVHLTAMVHWIWCEAINWALDSQQLKTQVNNPLESQNIIQNPIKVWLPKSEQNTSSVLMIRKFNSDRERARNFGGVKWFYLPITIKICYQIIWWVKPTKFIYILMVMLDHHPSTHPPTSLLWTRWWEPILSATKMKRYRIGGRKGKKDWNNFHFGLISCLLIVCGGFIECSRRKLLTWENLLFLTSSSSTPKWNNPTVMNKRKNVIGEK